MHTMENQPARFSKPNLAALIGLAAVCVLALQARAAEQPKPGPEHQKLEVAVGRWKYEGSAQTSPFAEGGKFKGKSNGRMVLGGFFLEMREEDKSEDGYVYQGIILRGYDGVAKTYTDHAFENDGSVTPRVITVSGNTWIAVGARTDSKGQAYKTRSTETYAADGRSFTFSAEYSADNGNTWLPMWKGTMKRVGK